MKTLTAWFARVTMNAKVAAGRFPDPVAAIVILAGLVITASIVAGCVSSANAQAAAPACSVGTLNGVYGFQRSGQTPQGPLTAVGIGTFDGLGNLTGSHQTISRSGAFSVSVGNAPTYSVNSDCTGTLIDANGVAFGQFVIVHDGNEVLGMSLNPGNNVAIHFERLADLK